MLTFTEISSLYEKKEYYQIINFAQNISFETQFSDKIYDCAACSALMLSKFDIAKDFLERLLIMGYKNSNIYFNLGKIEKILNNKELAIKYYENSLLLNTNHIDTLVAYGVLLVEERLYKKANNILKKAINLNSNNHVALNNLGYISYIESNFEKSIFYCLKAIESNPNYVEAYNNLSVVYINQEKLEEAEKIILKAIEINPNFQKTYLNYAEVLKKKGFFHESENIYKKALELDYGNNIKNSII